MSAFGPLESSLGYESIGLPIELSDNAYAACYRLNGEPFVVIADVQSDGTRFLHLAPNDVSAISIMIAISANGFDANGVEA